MGEAEDVALVDEGGCTPLDRLHYPWVGAEDDLAGPLHGVGERMIELPEPAFDI
jgi:hypothetical protein